MEIDRWEVGCYVRGFDWIDGENYYLHMEYYSPGSSLSRPPEKERSILIPKTPENEYKIRNYLNSIVTNVMFSIKGGI